MENIKYEKLPLKEYQKLYDQYTQIGLLIKNGEEIVFTDWAIQNGLVSGLKNNNGKYIKIKNHKDGRRIVVKRKWNVQGKNYWAGFWKLLK